TWPGGGSPVEIRAVPGQRKIEVKKDGFTTFVKELTVKANDSEEVDVRLEPLAAARPGRGESDGLEAKRSDNLVVGRWLHSGGGNRDLPVEFKVDGTSSANDGTTGTWSLSGSKLTLRWSSNQAPGGEWIDETRLSADGRRYEGKDIFGKPVSGFR